MVRNCRDFLPQILVFAAFPNFFARAPQQSLPHVRFRGGSATQKVVQTKTQLGRGSTMSAPDAGSAAAVTKAVNCDCIVLIEKDKPISIQPRRGRAVSTGSGPELRGAMPPATSWCCWCGSTGTRTRCYARPATRSTVTCGRRPSHR